MEATERLHKGVQTARGVVRHWLNVRVGPLTSGSAMPRPRPPGGRPGALRWTSAPRWDEGVARSHSGARNRLSEVIERDRALLEAHEPCAPSDETCPAPGVPVAAGFNAPRDIDEAVIITSPQPSSPPMRLPAGPPAPPTEAAPAAQTCSPREASDTPAESTQGTRSPGTDASTIDLPFRTRTMARLLLSQGKPEQARAIYAELCARAPDDADLRAEAERAKPV